ncbi:MAG TPA: DUF6152 family protein [Micropepsaceae bacterium]|nr:DUF6152 family protein [Micropepsaceae bacterium]
MKMSLPVMLSAAAALAVTGVAPVEAHHSFALFDVTRTIELEGTVKSFEWTNPHSWVRLEVMGPQNTTKEWLIELPPAGALAREGLSRNFVKPGEHIVVHVNPLKNGGEGGSLARFIFDDRPR